MVHLSGDSNATRETERQMTPPFVIPAEPLQLSRLRTGTPGITPHFGGCLCEAAVICLEQQNHTSGVTLRLSGELTDTVELAWDRVPDQARACWADPQVAVEHGAYGVAILIIDAITEYTVVERSRKGTGFDFWLGSKIDPTSLFQNKARLEVSGILVGSDSEIRQRVREKLIQMNRGGIDLPGYAVVTEFSRPESRVSVP
jgi:hypothetical protein